ncbi:MAG TPA: hypothetical protein VFH22_09840, partial [Rhodocyclaceae bacterium]|nr:hypothetical protein [Rhodocyclaceae bacterium]
VVALTLPGSGLAARLTLPPASAAVLTRQGRALATHWAGNEALQETVLTGNADQLLLLNAGADEARYGVELASASGKSEPSLKPGELFERNLASQGRLRIPVELPKSLPGAATTYRLRVAGHGQALWQERGGRVAAGEDIAIGDAGALWVQHRPGTLVAWVEETGTGDAARGERWRKDFGETRVIPPQTINLNGKQKLLGFDFAQPTMLHVRSETPLVSQFVVNGQAARTDAHLHGAQANFPLPAGKGLLLLRAVGADSLSGAVTVNTTPVLKLNEGPGPQVLLGPGSARLFWFELAQPATIGLGVRASADVIRAVLYDEHGLVKSEGVVQMPALAAGRYFLMVEMPAESAPVSVQPIVLGLARPDTRPPYEILRRYVEHVELGDGEGAALLYVPPPPAPPPSTVEVPADEAGAGEGGTENGEGDGAAENGGPDQEFIEEHAGDMPAEEAQ